MQEDLRAALAFRQHASNGRHVPAHRHALAYVIPGLRGGDGRVGSSDGLGGEHDNESSDEEDELVEEEYLAGEDEDEQGGVKK